MQLGISDLREALVKMAFNVCVVFVAFTVLFAESFAQHDLCKTPHNEPGECKIITHCESLLKIVKHRPIKSIDADYLRRARCKLGGKLPKVCCPLNENTQRENYSQAKPADSPLLPSIEQCGIGKISNKIFGGKNTDLDEFPWMALIKYKKENGKFGFYCGGALINNRYVLTAAHCIKGENRPKSIQVVGVRVGEYDMSTPIDCVSTPDGTKCAPPALDVTIEEIIIHEYYVPSDTNQYHDIALLRLSSPVTFSDYIQPICLPKSAAIQAHNFMGQKLTVSGWGATKYNLKSIIKQKVNIPVKPNKVCSTAYKKEGAKLQNSQLCVGGEEGKDSCGGDSGDPLMAYIADENEDYLLNWFAVGIVSYGYSPCGQEGFPGVYTKVANYVPWIVSKLRP